jgi:hypothetical protein
MSGPSRELSRREINREDLAATLAARQELGADFEPALVESLAERLQGVIDARVEARLAGRPPQALSPKMRLALALTSLGIAFPCTGVAADLTGLPGVIVVWTGIVLVNVAVAFGPRGSR